MINKICIHHTGDSRKNHPYQFLIVDNYHKQKWDMRSSLGFYGGYNYLIEPTGYCMQYRKEGEETAAVIGYNKDSIHICMAGDFNVEMPTTGQIETLKKMLFEKMKTYFLTIKDIYYHRDLQENRNCPGDLIGKDWIKNLLEPAILPPEDKEKVDNLIIQKMTIIQQILALIQRLKELLS